MAAAPMASGRAARSGAERSRRTATGARGKDPTSSGDPAFRREDVGSTCRNWRHSSVLLSYQVILPSRDTCIVGVCSAGGRPRACCLRSGTARSDPAARVQCLRQSRGAERRRRGAAEGGAWSDCETVCCQRGLSLHGDVWGHEGSRGSSRDGSDGVSRLVAGRLLPAAR